MALLQVRLAAWHKLEVDQLASAFGNRVEPGVSSAFGLAEALLLRGSGEVASALMDLRVGGVDDLQLIDRCRRTCRFLDHPFEQAAFGPSVVEAVDALPLAILRGEWVPLATRYEDPPDVAKRFEKIGQKAAFNLNAGQHDLSLGQSLTCSRITSDISVT
ncbi:hypothetical protein HNR46_000107 [Haloferula luteola]|uniref:Uncharacterized protein n=1 Tax=Haloferula luteola TaxID=595692 RepID=A0A840UYI3_9BACT|nr:hypothetical protein [Haloferula luteola]MBB5349886.1 hypothetical protein [Haloferula luteola]